MDFKLKVNDPKEARRFFKQKLAFTTGPIEVDYARKHEMKFILVDVRAAEDYAQEHAVGAIGLPESQWSTLNGLDKDTLNVLYCYSHVCHLAARAAVYFASRGYPVMEMDGGFKAWKDHDLETERGVMETKKVA